jgi:hypothetical protein
MAIQDSVNCWGNLLIATGEVLQPAKCFYLIISFEWINGEWHHVMNANQGDFGILVPLPGSSNARISHKPVNHAEKTLVAMTSLDGNSCAAICMMQEKTQQWINVVRNGHIHHWNVWFSLKVQFFPRVCYGLCSSTATFKELELALHCQYYQILPMGGVVPTAIIRSKTMDVGFYGIGFPHLGVKALVAMTNKLLMHYGCQTVTGRFLQTSLSLLFVEQGLSFQLLQESYEQFEFLVTHSWFKMLWKKLSKFGVRVVVANLPTEHPREGDQFIMQVLIKMGYTNKMLLCLNHVHVFLQVLFMSDIRTASGHKINPEVLSRRPPDEAGSSMRWPTEQPTDLDLHLLMNDILSIYPSRSSTLHVCRFTVPTQKIWRWTWSKEEATFYHLQEDGVTEDVFVLEKKPKLLPFLPQPTSKQSQHNLLSRTYSGQWELASDILGATHQPSPSPQIIPGGPSFMGQHLALGTPASNWRRIMA